MLPKELLDYLVPIPPNEKRQNHILLFDRQNEMVQNEDRGAKESSHGDSDCCNEFIAYFMTSF